MPTVQFVITFPDVPKAKRFADALKANCPLEIQEGETDIAFAKRLTIKLWIKEQIKLAERKTIIINADQVKIDSVTAALEAIDSETIAT
jgi:hypothetical protein